MGRVIKGGRRGLTKLTKYLNSCDLKEPAYILRSYQTIKYTHVNYIHIPVCYLNIQMSKFIKFQKIYFLSATTFQDLKSQFSPIILSGSSDNCIFVQKLINEKNMSVILRLAALKLVATYYLML